ncbi:MAG TPA: hypothetical protein VE817_03035, partial [Candidatus Acidoferrum sp.]|nr:hypothetical protein [Candidatus Acidoferrum sp.]
WISDYGRERAQRAFDVSRRKLGVGDVDLFDFAPRADEVAAVDRLDTGVRGGPDPNAIDPDRKPLTIPD